MPELARRAATATDCTDTDRSRVRLGVRPRARRRADVLRRDRARASARRRRSRDAARLLADAYRARGWSEADTQLLRRLRFAELAVDVDALLRAAAAGRRAIDEIDLRAALDWPAARDLDRLRAGDARRPERPDDAAQLPGGRHASSRP